MNLIVCGSCPFFDAKQLEQILQPNFSVSIQSDCSLISIRHYSDEVKNNTLENHPMLVYGDINGTFQLVYQESKS